ncbi:MAG: DUF3089 domain-containing protein [Anaerolineales bacterium]|nr:DUF3089 domain-containing protein [Anaerolineales bacterium]
MGKLRLWLPVIGLAGLLLTGCAVRPVTGPAAASVSQAAPSDQPTDANAPVQEPVDSADPQHWLSFPVTASKAVDVFYLYPTVFRKAGANSPNIATIDDPGMLQQAQIAYARQATAFERTANVYAPYYRQADAVYTLNLPPAEQAQVVRGTPLADATAAFQYYLEHDNEGRPFILAGHRHQPHHLDKV